MEISPRGNGGPALKPSGEGGPARRSPSGEGGCKRNALPDRGRSRRSDAQTCQGSKHSRISVLPVMPDGTPICGVALRLLERTRAFFGGELMEDGYPYNRDRYGRADRDRTDRAGDEVRSWLGDEEAARRRRMDEQERWRAGSHWGNERSYSSDREYGDGGYGWRNPRESAGDARVTYGRDDRPAPTYAPY